MCCLHRLLDDRHYLFTQLPQVHLMAQGRAESGQCASYVVLAAVKALVDGGLNASLQWLQQPAASHRAGRTARRSHAAHAPLRKGHLQRATCRGRTTRRVPVSRPACLDEQTTETHRREEVMRRHAWISPSTSGTLNQKVEPRPGALSTPTCPWCCSTIALAMANPSPNPP